MTLIDQAPHIYLSHFKINEHLSGLDNPDPYLERADYNANGHPTEDVIEWLEPFAEAIRDDPSVYRPNPDNFHYTLLRLGLVENIPEETIADFSSQLQARFADYEVPELKLNPPKVGAESITAEFDEESQVVLMEVRKIILGIAEVALGDKFEKPAWYMRGENGPRLHVSLVYLKDHTDADKERLRAKIASANLGKIATEFLSFAVLKQIAKPKQGHYKQDEVVKKILLKPAEALAA